MLESISQTFQSHPELDQLIQTLNQFVVGFGKATQRGLSAASPIMKGLGRGNMIHNIPQGLESYAPYLQHTEGAKNVAWIKWQLSGNDYLEMADQCPYCSGSIEKTREKIKRVRNVYDAKSIEHLDHLIEVYTALMPYADIYGIRLSSLILLSENMDEAEKSGKGTAFVRNMMAHLIQSMSAAAGDPDEE